MNENPKTTHFPFGQFFCVTAMAIRREWRNLGIGTAIISRLKEIAIQENCVKIILETSHAQQFYLEQSFYVIGTREQMGTKLIILGYDL
jgi:GNAT superfamily N-acetyltransferase